MLTEEYLQRLVDQCLPAARQGKVASYIPKLAEADGNQLGVYWMEPNGAGVGAGQWQKRVTVQSIVKVAIFLQALADCPLEQMTQKISLNATAETFNSIVDLEEKNQHRPLNPYINSGAIATLSLVQGGPGQRFQRVLELLQALTGNSRLTVEEEVYRSEKATGDRNRALAYFMRSTQILSEEVEPLLDDYFRLCSVLVDCRDLAAFAATLAKGGVDPLTGRRCASREHCRTALAVMVFLWDVRPIRRLFGAHRGAGQKRRGRGHHGRGARPGGHWRHRPGPQRHGKFQRRHGAAGKAGPTAGSQHFVIGQSGKVRHL